MPIRKFFVCLLFFLTIKSAETTHRKTYKKNENSILDDYIRSCNHLIRLGELDIPSFEINRTLAKLCYRETGSIQQAYKKAEFHALEALKQIQYYKKPDRDAVAYDLQMILLGIYHKGGHGVQKDRVKSSKIPSIKMIDNFLNYFLANYHPFKEPRHEPPLADLKGYLKNLSDIPYLSSSLDDKSMASRIGHNCFKALGFIKISTRYPELKDPERALDYLHVCAEYKDVGVKEYFFIKNDVIKKLEQGAISDALGIQEFF